MLEMKITITATDLASAINNLAAALEGKKSIPATVESVQVAPVSVQQPVTPTAPITPTPATTPVVIPAPVATQQAATPAEPVSITGTAAPTVAPTVAPTPVQTNAAPTVPGVPTSAPQYTLDMIATAGSTLIDAGKMDQLMGLLGKFGVASLTELAPENYGAMANELRALGAAI